MRARRAGLIIAGLAGAAGLGLGVAAFLLGPSLLGSSLLGSSGPRRPEGPVHVSSAMLKGVPVAAPAGAAKGLAILISDRGGPGAADARQAEALRDRGLIVLRVDLEAWRAALDAQTTACLRPIVEMELLAKEAQRALGEQDTYLRPVVVGTGEGGTLAQAILARSFPATLGGGVALDLAPVLRTARPLCDDGAPVAAPEPVPGGGFRYPLPERTQAALSLISAEPLPPGTGGAGPFTVERQVETDPAHRASAAVDAAAAIAAQDAGTGGLPVVDLPSATGRTRAVALFFSGDGGWRDIDKTVGEHLTREGIHVVGLDALRYFWRERDPKTVAADVAAMLQAADPGRSLPVIVLGYSFGADLFPFAWPYLPPGVKERVRLIALMAPGRSTGFTVSVKGFLGFGGAHAVLPQLAALPRDRVLCIYGSKETDSPCVDPALAGAATLKITGGHHFDYDYPALASQILAAARLPE